MVHHHLKRQLYGQISQMKNTNNIRIGILVYPYCTASGATIPYDIFTIANQLRLLNEHNIFFNIIWIHAKHTTTTHASKLIFPSEQACCEKIDVLYIPGSNLKPPLERHFFLENSQEEIRFIAECLRKNKTVVASDSGCFLLAETGMINCKSITTSWWWVEHFEAWYPNIVICQDSLIHENGNIITTGGGTSYIELTLWLIEKYGGKKLHHLTENIIYADYPKYNRTHLASTEDSPCEKDELIKKAKKWLRNHITIEWTIDELAQYCHISQRTLLRRFQEIVQMSPIQYMQKIRIEHAQKLLTSTSLTMECITEQCGYMNVSTFNKTFKKWTNLTPKEYRLQYKKEQQIEPMLD